MTCFPVTINGQPLYIPTILQEKYGQYTTAEHYATDNKIPLNKALWQLTNDRFNHDFEFWAYMSIKIKPKSSADKTDQTQELIPFKLRYPQRYLLKELIHMWYQGIPVRIIIVKARQWGGSTLVQVFLAWIQLVKKTYWNSVIIGDVENQSKNVLSMYTRLLQHYPSN